MSVKKRIVVHFPGFEPLSAADHRNRYARSAEQSAKVWNCEFGTGDLSGNQFSVTGRGPDWQTETDVTVLDHDQLISGLRAVPLWRQLLLGFWAAVQVVFEGGMTGYFRHAWRFGIFFIFPFLFIICGLEFAATIALAPVILDWPRWHLLWSVPAAGLFFERLFLPFSDRFHTLHLFADWRLTVHAARLNDAETNAWLDRAANSLREALAEEADEYLITAHSMGASLALHAIGMVLERDPQAFGGKSVTFATLGGAALQCALLRSAKILRERIRLTATCSDIVWFEVQSLTDPVHLYKAHTVSAAGFPGIRQPPIVPFRFRTVLSEERYKRIKTDILRMHRQYVLGPDRRGSFDFTLMTAGPLPAAVFRTYNQQVLPPIGPDGSVGRD